MSDREVGFRLSFAAQVDPENQDQVQITADAPVGATPEDLAAVIAVMRKAIWFERIACNERILHCAEVVNEARDRRVAEFRERNETVDEEMIADERAVTNATLVKMASKIEADRAAVGV